MAEPTREEISKELENFIKQASRPKTPEVETREQEIKAIWKNYDWFYRMLRGLLLIGVGVFVGLLIYSTPQAREAYSVNVFTSILSLGATALIFDELNRKRSRDELKRQLVMDAASSSNEKAKDAIHQLRSNEWLEGENGLLKGADLQDANLQKAKLTKANLHSAKISFANLEEAELNSSSLVAAEMEVTNLHRAHLENAKLQNARMFGVDLRDASLISASLQMADLNSARLQKARLDWAKLQNVNLKGANLCGATLRYANLQGANLQWTEFDESTVLPDESYWFPETDMQRFTDPIHPDFQRDWYMGIK